MLKHTLEFSLALAAQHMPTHTLDFSRALVAQAAHPTQQCELMVIGLEIAKKGLEQAIPFFAALLLVPDERASANLVGEFLSRCPDVVNKPIQTEPHVLYPLHFAIERGSLSLVDVLLEAGADPALKAGAAPINALECAAGQSLRSTRAAEAITQAILDRGNFTPKQKAKALDTAADRNVGAVRALLRSGADFSEFNSRGNFPTPLHRACFIPEDDKELAKNMVKVMLEALKGPLMHQRESVLDKGWRTHNDTLGTPLHCAAFQGHAELIEPLLAAGAQLEGPRGKQGPTKHWFTPLMAAALAGQGDAVVHLLEAGASPTSIDGNGRTALHYLASPELEGECLDLPEVRQAIYRAAERLVAAGADLAARDLDGDTPLDRARQFDDEGLVEQLKRLAGPAASPRVAESRRSRAPR